MARPLFSISLFSSELNLCLDYSLLIAIQTYMYVSSRSYPPSSLLLPLHSHTKAMSIPTDNLRAQIAGFEERARTWLRSQSKDVDNLASMHDASVQESNGTSRHNLLQPFYP